MTKAEIIQNIHEKTGLAKNESAQMLEAVLEIMKDTLESGEKIKISGFGTFTVKKKNARRGRNPQTGETITLSPRSVLTFKPSTVLKTSINK